jgi:nucleotide-binding universal stress UspA family protein
MYMNILVPVDLQESVLTERALQAAKDIAGHYDAQITIMTVIPDFGMPVVANFFPDDAMEKARKEVVAELDKFVAAHFDDPSKVRTRVLDGTPHKVIIDYAEGHDTDLIVLPARVKDLSKVFMGSSSTHVAERAPCSVLIVRA